jgi:arsenite methyltransferase
VIDDTLRQPDEELKACCADLYSSEFTTWLLGDSFHPGGLSLTRRLGELLKLGPGDHVLDVASGRGTSAIELAEWFGCRVTGVDFGEANVAAAREAARKSPAEDLTTFLTGDAEQLPLDAGIFDAVICECSLCTFPNKSAAAHEFFRVLRPGGRMGLSDLTRNGPLPVELNSVIGTIICVANACPTEDYQTLLTTAGLQVDRVEKHDDALMRLVAEMRTRLLAGNIITRTQGLNLPDIDFDYAQTTARRAAEAVADETLGYSLLIARKPLKLPGI